MIKKKKKRLLDSRFYRVYFVVVAAALVAILVFTVWLMGYQREYESAQPIYVAQDVARLFEQKDFADLYALDSAAERVSGGDRDAYVENLTELAAGKDVQWSEGFSETDDRHTYNVTLDGDRFASFTLVKSGRATRRGHPLWTLGYVTTNVAVEETPVETPEPTSAPTPAPAAQVRVTALRGYTVYVDGVALTVENSAMTEKPLYEEGFLPENVGNPVLVTYEYGVPDAAAPEVVVTDTFQSPMPLKQTAENTWVCGMTESEAFKSQFAEASLTLAKNIAKYTSKDGSKDAILKYCAKDCPARTVFNNLSNQYATPHSQVTFQNENVGEFYQLSDDCFTCRVTFDYLMKTKDGVKTDPTAYTFCIVMSGDSGKLYNLLMS